MTVDSMSHLASALRRLLLYNASEAQTSGYIMLPDPVLAQTFSSPTRDAQTESSSQFTARARSTDN